LQKIPVEGKDVSKWTSRDLKWRLYAAKKEKTKKCSKCTSIALFLKNGATAEKKSFVDNQ